MNNTTFSALINKGFLSNKYLIAILAIYTIIFLPHALIINENLGMIRAFEIDAGSIITTINKMFEFPFYNMMQGHTLYYGWTYSVLNFIILLPVKLFMLLFGINNDFLILFTIRFTLFTIGFFLVTFFYLILEALLKNKLLAVFGALLFIFSYVNSFFLYYIHPESTGLLFLFIAIWILVNYITGSAKNSKYYFYALICLILSSLSKQIFFFMSLPVLFLFFHFHCFYNKHKYLEYIKTKEFLKVFGITWMISIALFFVIHPYAFFNFNQFFAVQKSMLGVHAHHEFGLSASDSMIRWSAVFKTKLPLISASIYLIPFAFGTSLYLYIRNKNPHVFFYLVNTISISLLLFLTMFNSRLSFSPHHIIIYSFFIIFFLSTINYLIKVKKTAIKILIIAISSYFLIFFLAWDIYNSGGSLLKRFNYKTSAAYLSYNYIKENITQDAKVAYGYFTGMPDQWKNSCSYSDGCSMAHKLNDFNPDYVMFWEGYSLNGHLTREVQTYKEYVTRHNFSLIDKIKGEKRYITGNRKKVLLEISVWKRNNVQTN